MCWLIQFFCILWGTRMLYCVSLANKLRPLETCNGCSDLEGKMGICGRGFIHSYFAYSELWTTQFVDYSLCDRSENIRIITLRFTTSTYIIQWIFFPKLALAQELGRVKLVCRKCSPEPNFARLVFTFLMKALRYFVNIKHSIFNE